MIVFKHFGQFPSMQSFEVESHVCFNQIVSSGQYHLNSNLNLFLSLKVKYFHRLHIKWKSVGCHYCKPPPYAFSGENSCSKASENEGKLVIILDTLTNW